MIVTDNVLYGVIAVCVVYLAAMYVLQRVKAGSHEKKIQKAREEYEQAKQAQQQEKTKLIETISFVYGNEQAHYVSMGKLWVGMPMHLLMIALGKANNIKQSVAVDAITQVWYYSEFDKLKGANQDKLEVVLVNNEVVSWKELA